MKTKALFSVLVMACAVTLKAAIHVLVVQVVDYETGEPIVGAEVAGCFLHSAAFWAEETSTSTGVTVLGGITTFTNWAVLGKVHVIARKLGEYHRGSENFTLQPFEAIAFRKIRLHRIRKAEKLRKVGEMLLLDCANAAVAVKEFPFDFVSRDFLPPYGTGVVADVVLRYEGLKNRVPFPSGYTTVGNFYFPGEGNGGVFVPKGEDSSWVMDSVPIANLKSRLTVSDYEKKSLGFRIRSKFDSEGKLIDGYYGYIDNPYLFIYFRKDFAGKQKQIILKFTYIINLNPCENYVSNLGINKIFSMQRDIDVDGNNKCSVDWD